MKIGIVGCGAVGSYYGALLCRAGHPTHFLLRSDLKVVQRDGVRIQSVEGDFHVRPFVSAQPEAIGPCELVLIGLKTTANHRFAELLPPLIDDQTRVLTLQNGLGNEDQLAALFEPDHVLGALCFVCLNRVAPGVIRHLAHGRIVVGAYRRPPDETTLRLAKQFQAAGIRCTVAEDLAQAHWEKLIWNIPFNGLGVAGVVGYENYLAGRIPPAAWTTSTLPTDALLADPRWLAHVRALMTEVITAANALGYPVPMALADENVNRTRVMGAYRASTLLDFERGLPLELDSLFREPQRQARRTGVPTPALDRLCAVLAELEQRRPSRSGKL